MPLRSLLNLTGDTLHTLPLLILYLTDGCNSRCVTCDIWRNPRRNMPLALAQTLIEAAAELGTHWVLLSGGEAMQHPQWPQIAAGFRQRGIRVLLLTNGLLVRKQITQVADTVDDLIISLDAATPDVYSAIRGVDALSLVLEGIQAAHEQGIAVTTRTTVQRRNYHQLADIADAALGAGANSVSYLAVDTSSSFAFGERDITATSDALDRADCDVLEQMLKDFAISHADQFANGQIAESPQKLRRTLLNYFRQDTAYTAPRCNSPRFSVVVEVDGTLRPCYFLPSNGRLLPNGPSLSQAINTDAAKALRQAIRTGQRAECTHCVCPLYKSPRALVKM